MNVDLFRNDKGFSTVGMAVALLVSLTLVFSSLQIYRINSVAAEIQEVADVSALAAQNQVAEFMIAVKASDALVLSMTLFGTILYGTGVITLCVPGLGPASTRLLELGSQIFEKRNRFAQFVAEGLNRVQKGLPALMASSALAVASSNKIESSGTSYNGIAIAIPEEGEEISVESTTGKEALEDAVAADEERLRELTEAVEQAAEKANDAKMEGFLADCGANPRYCLYERAKHLAHMTGSDNPMYNSVDTWSFAVALNRAKAYYEQRFYQERPQSDAPLDIADSRLRLHFYSYAREEIPKGYVHETEDSFDAYFPVLPRNTEEMKQTRLYTDAKYPISSQDGALTLHVWPGCPGATDIIGFGSLSQVTNRWVTCEICKFKPSSLGKIAAASTAIENGFEYHYIKVAEAAKRYKEARIELDPMASEVKEKAHGLLEQVGEVMREAASYRIKATPPGSLGTIALATSSGMFSPDHGFEGLFVRGSRSLGTRLAVAGATMIEESSDEGKDVINSLLSRFQDNDLHEPGLVGFVLGCWSHLLKAYSEGTIALTTALERVLDHIPLASASGLGSWVADKFRLILETLGLEPANLNALKPVLVNTADVSSADDGAFSRRYRQLQEGVFSGIGDLWSLAGGSP